jgi:hypothetical protein
LSKTWHLFQATKDTIQRDEIAARQAWLPSEHLGPREKKLRLIDARQMFVEMKHHARPDCKPSATFKTWSMSELREAELGQLTRVAEGEPLPHRIPPIVQL